MAGIMIPILKKTAYDFSNLTNSNKAIVLIEPYIDTLSWREATLVLRFHVAPVWSAGAKIEADLLWTDQCPDDPSVFFNYPNQNAIGVVVQQSDSPAPGAGYLKTGTATSGLLGTMGVGLTFTQATAANTFQATLSIDLFLKV